MSRVRVPPGPPNHKHNRSLCHQRFFVYSKNVVKKYVIASIVIAFLVAGFFIPMDAYTTTGGCPDDSIPTTRLHFIFGGSTEDIKNEDIKNRDEEPSNLM